MGNLRNGGMVLTSGAKKLDPSGAQDPYRMLFYRMIKFFTKKLKVWTNTGQLSSPEI